MQHSQIAPELTRLDDLAEFAAHHDMDALIARMRELYGVKHITYHSFFRTKIGEISPYVKTTYRPEWVSRYLTMSYMSIDPVVASGFGRVLPFDWARLDKSEAPVRQLFGESVEFGVGRHGFSIPIVGQRAKGLLSITSDESHREWSARIRSLLKDFQTIAGFMHNKAFSETGQAAEPTPLSRREIECLQWAALGKTDDEISEILGLSRLTIASYVKSARYKLGCINRVSAVARAIALGIIQP